TSADDDCNVDCFVITHVPLRTGQVVECEVVGLMEQFEDGQVDHNVLARLRGSQSTADDDVQTTLQQFVTNVFAHVPNKHIEVGRFLGPEEAEAHITAHTDR
ncbi:MAG: inorganic diphosphatase, partial [Vicinamibacterales bacterium]